MICKNQNAASVFRCIWFATLLVRAGGLIFSFLALYLQEERQLPPTMTGFVVGSWGFGYLLAGLTGGVLAYVISPRLLVALGSIGGIASASILNSAQHMNTLAFGSFLLGLSSEISRPVLAVAVHETTLPEGHRLGHSRMFWAANLGTVAANLAGGYLIMSGFRQLFIANAIANVLFAVVVLPRLPAVLAARPPASAKIRRSSHLLAGLNLLAFGVMVVLFQWTTTLPLEMARHGLRPHHFGQVMAVSSAFICVLQPIISRLTQHVEDYLLLACGAVFVGVGFGANVHAHNFSTFLCAVLIWTLGELLFCPTCVSVIANTSAEESQTMALGMHQFAVGAGYMTAPILGGIIWESTQKNVLWIGCAALCFLCAFTLFFFDDPTDTSHMAPLADSGSQ